MPIAVLLCDDHPTFARGLGSLLDREADDIQVVGIATGAEMAVRLVRDLLPDVVLMDVRMPQVDGIEATRQIRTASPTTRVVMLTVSDDPGDLHRALRAGACGWIGKDCDAGDVAETVRAVHRDYLVLPSELAAELLGALETFQPCGITEEERALLAGIARGETNRDLASRLHLSERTVRRRIEDIYSKLHLADRLQAAIWAREQGIGGDR
jgi:DNA-binding NarL/FixJ family response regulator